MKFFKLSLALMLLPGLAAAQGGSGTINVSSVLIDPSYNVVMIVGASAWSNPDGCAGSTIVLLSTSNPLYKDMLAATLTALTAGKTMSFWVSGCTNSSWGTAPTVVLTQVNS